MAVANWTSEQVLDQLNSDTRWSGSTITYSFPGSSSGMYSQGEATGFRAVNANQQALMLLALATWDDLMPQAFAAGAAGSTNLEFAYTSTSIGYAHAYFPSIGSIYFNANQADLVTTAVGQYGFQTYIHEIGHSLGLNHMGDYNGNGNWAPSSFQDSVVLSVMSYFGPYYAAPNYSAEVMQADWVADDGRTYSAQTPMVNDALAIQAIYGSSATTRLGDTVYGFGSTVAGSLGMLYDFARNAHPILTLYDSGGIDTLNLSGWGSASRIDLRPGAYSSANSMTNNIAIAYTALIENAEGGAAADVIIGNEAANLLVGNGGNDELFGGGGDDVLVGGAGNDTLDGGDGSNDTALFDGPFAAYTVSVVGGVVTVTGGSTGTDRITGVERFQFSDSLHTINDLSPGADLSAPVLQALTPTDNSTNVAAGANLVLVFNEAVSAGNGTFSIFNADGSLFRSMAANDGTQLRFVGNSVAIDPAVNLPGGRSYYVTVSGGAIADLAGNAYAGFSAATAWNFSVGASDTSAPVVAALTPADDSSNVAVNSNLAIEFNEAVVAGSGNIVIRDGGTVVRYIAVGSSQVSISGSTVSIDLDTDLATGRSYSITVDAGAFRDAAGNSFAGLLSTSAWTLTTRAGAAPDDFPYATNTTGVVAVNGAASSGVIEVSGDADLFRVVLTAGTTYTFSLNRTTGASGGLHDPVLTVYGEQGTGLTQLGFDDDGGGSGNARLSLTPATNGTFYLAVSDYDTGTGAYLLQASSLDQQAPTLTARTPADDSSQVDAAANLVLVFSETVRAGAGTLRILDNNGLVVREISAANTALVQFNGNTVTVDPGQNLPAGSSLHVNVDTGAFQDSAGNAYAGLFGSTAWNFNTRAVTLTDDFPLSVDTPGVLAVGSAGISARIDSAGDGDLFKVNLAAGVTYRFDLVASQAGALDPFLALYGQLPEVELIAYDDDGGPQPLDSRLYFTAFQSGTYYLAARDYAEATGSYRLTASVPVDDFVASPNSSGRVTVGGASTQGNINVPSDTDLLGVMLTAGTQYTLKLNAIDLDDPYLVLLGPDGSTLLASDDDSGGNLNSQITYTALTSGLHWVAASDYDVGFGRYAVSAFVRNVIEGSAAPDSLTGGAGPDSLYGRASADILRGQGGDDLLDGGDQIDMALYAGNSNAYTLGRVEGGWAVAATSGTEGRDLLYSVERLGFANARWALDLDGHAGTTVKILGAVFGSQEVHNAEYVGIGLQLLDGGWSYPDLMQLALDARLGVAAGPTALVNLLYSNVVGVLPDTPTRLYYEGLLASGEYTSSSLGILAADIDLNLANIDLVGLMRTGVAYFES